MVLVAGMIASPCRLALGLGSKASAVGLSGGNAAYTVLDSRPSDNSQTATAPHSVEHDASCRRGESGVVLHSNEVDPWRQAAGIPSHSSSAGLGKVLGRARGDFSAGYV